MGAELSSRHVRCHAARLFSEVVHHLCRMDLLVASLVFEKELVNDLEGLPDRRLKIVLHVKSLSYRQRWTRYRVHSLHCLGQVSCGAINAVLNHHVQSQRLVLSLRTSSARGV